MGLIFDGIDIENGFIIPLHVEAKLDYSFPEREYNSVHVPGRNGNILEDIGSYPNVEVIYQLSCGTNGQFDYLSIARSIKDWLTKNPGYHVLRDTYEPDVFRFACFHSACTIGRVTDNGARFQIQFDCMPQKYYRSTYPPPEGQSTGYVMLTSPNTSGQVDFSNPETRNSKPLIELSSSGFSHAGNDVFTMTFRATNIDTVTIVATIPGNAPSKIYIDSELEEVYDESGTPRNSYVTLSNNKFPELPANKGITIVTTGNFTGGAGRTIKIYPRFWTL